MKLQELLNETGNSPAEFQLVDGARRDAWYIEAPELSLRLALERDFLYKLKQNRVLIVFSVENKFYVTGEGNAIKIFSTVNAMLNEYLVKFLNPNDDRVSFSADSDETSRIKLYNRAIPVISNILGNGWEYTDKYDNREGKRIYSWVRREQELKEVAVASTWITELVYTRSTKTLTMTLNNGRRFAIKGISRQSFDRWKDAPSKGSYFHQHIRDKFNITRTR